MPVRKNRRTILVVDDSLEILRYYRTRLELDSYRVETAASGAEALRALRNGLNPDVVILDWQMPHWNGLSTLKRLRKLRPELKVIICSGEMNSWIQQQISPYRVEACLCKPVDHLYLSAALDRCFPTRPATKLDPREHGVLPFPTPSGSASP